jgi:hypothetical protein
MGNNAAFTAFEATVIAVYNEGVLDKKLLSALMKSYEGVDIDHGGVRRPPPKLQTRPRQILAYCGRKMVLTMGSALMVQRTVQVL